MGRLELSERKKKILAAVVELYVATGEPVGSKALCDNLDFAVSSATVRNDSFPDTGFKGTVGFISSVAEFTPKNVETPDLRTALVYEVRIIVDDPDNRLRLGAPATVTIPLDQNAGTQTPEQPRP